MAFDYFLKLEGISGESKADKHKDEIDILSWSWGRNFVDQGFQGTFKFRHTIDKASPQLLDFACAHKSPGPATLTASKTADRQRVDYYTIKLSNTMIQSLEQQGDPVGAPTEEVELSFNGITEDYTVVRRDGGLGQTFHGECKPEL